MLLLLAFAAAEYLAQLGGDAAAEDLAQRGFDHRCGFPCEESSDGFAWCDDDGTCLRNCASGYHKTEAPGNGAKRQARCAKCPYSCGQSIILRDGKPSCSDDGCSDSCREDNAYGAWCKDTYEDVMSWLEFETEHPPQKLDQVRSVNTRTPDATRDIIRLIMRDAGKGFRADFNLRAYGWNVARNLAVYQSFLYNVLDDLPPGSEVIAALVQTLVYVSEKSELRAFVQDWEHQQGRRGKEMERYTRERLGLDDPRLYQSLGARQAWSSVRRDPGTYPDMLLEVESSGELFASRREQSLVRSDEEDLKSA